MLSHCLHGNGLSASQGPTLPPDPNTSLPRNLPCPVRQNYLSCLLLLISPAYKCCPGQRQEGIKALGSPPFSKRQGFPPGQPEGSGLHLRSLCLGPTTSRLLPHPPPAASPRDLLKPILYTAARDLSQRETRRPSWQFSAALHWHGVQSQTTRAPRREPCVPSAGSRPHLRRDLPLMPSLHVCLPAVPLPHSGPAKGWGCLFILCLQQN